MIFAPAQTALAATDIAYAASGCTLNGKEVPCDQLFDQFGGLFAGLGVIMVVLPVIAIVGFVFWIMMLVHAASNPIENKAMWVVLLVFTGLLGAIVYYFIIKRPYSRMMGPRSMGSPLVPPRPPKPLVPPRPSGPLVPPLP